MILRKLLFVTGFLLATTSFPAHAGNSGAISVPHPTTGEWCLIGIDHIGPKKLPVDFESTYVIRLENRSSCSLRKLELIDELPDRFRYEGATPKPTKIERYAPPRGSTLRWRGIDLEPGQSEFVELQLSAHKRAEPEVRNNLCLRLPEAAEEAYCYWFKIKVVPNN